MITCKCKIKTLSDERVILSGKGWAYCRDCGHKIHHNTLKKLTKEAQIEYDRKRK